MAADRAVPEPSKNRYLRDHRGRPAYPLLSMFKAVLLGQWHSLSDPELEHSLITRIDFNLFCRFDELSSIVD
ncbi:putative transposase [Neisseria meningitidis NM140]|nr:putative transposase [Neisseria meningitidis NM140]